jgi:hypothetical protein
MVNHVEFRRSQSPPRRSGRQGEKGLYALPVARIADPEFGVSSVSSWQRSADELAEVCEDR